MEQIVRRMREVDAHHSRVKGSIVVNRLTSLSGYHHSGPLIYECRLADQFKKMQYKICLKLEISLWIRCCLGLVGLGFKDIRG